MAERRRRGTKFPGNIWDVPALGPPIWLYAEAALTRGVVPCRRFVPPLAVYQPLGAPLCERYFLSHCRSGAFEIPSIRVRSLLIPH